MATSKWCRAGRCSPPLAGLVESSALDPHVTKAVPFAEAATALAAVEAGHALGKTVLKVR
ncbi:zinc-binding dehydrogenase [Saccharothrix deserti]|uniref:zinc-binding dehydrogenase n=1 Tax=Saccharothrix deserti TaxID=2593674 RepID=UPI003B75BFE5